MKSHIIIFWICLFGGYLFAPLPALLYSKRYPYWATPLNSQILYASRVPTSLLGIDAKMYVKIIRNSSQIIENLIKIYTKSMKNQ